MSHEFRTPLNSIIILSELLEKNKHNSLHPKDIEYAQIIQQSGKSLLKLIDDFLDLSKIESGTIDVITEKVELLPFIQTLLIPHQCQAEKAGIQFIFNCTNVLPTYIETDHAKFKQVLDNLLSNVLKFTSEGVITISLVIENEQLKCSIQDTGIGIFPEDLNTIFEPFIQSAHINNTFGGTGLGLSISKQLSILIHGSLSVESTLQKGSAFSLYLPLSLEAIFQNTTDEENHNTTTSILLKK